MFLTIGRQVYIVRSPDRVFEQRTSTDARGLDLRRRLDNELVLAQDCGYYDGRLGVTGKAGVTAWRVSCCVSRSWAGSSVGRARD